MIWKALVVVLVLLFVTSIFVGAIAVLTSHVKAEARDSWRPIGYAQFAICASALLFQWGDAPIQQNRGPVNSLCRELDGREWNEFPKTTAGVYT